MLSKKILAVDHEPEDLASVQSILEDEGLEVSTAVTKDSAVSLARAKAPDLIILNATMPEEAAFCVLKDLRQDEATSNIPIMMLAPTHDRGAIKKGIDQGVNHFLTKPLSADDLTFAVQGVLLDNQDAFPSFL